MRCPTPARLTLQTFGYSTVWLVLSLLLYQLAPVLLTSAVLPPATMELWRYLALNTSLALCLFVWLPYRGIRLWQNARLQNPGFTRYYYQALAMMIISVSLTWLTLYCLHMIQHDWLELLAFELRKGDT